MSLLKALYVDLESHIEEFQRAYKNEDEALAIKSAERYSVAVSCLSTRREAKAGRKSKKQAGKLNGVIAAADKLKRGWMREGSFRSKLLLGRCLDGLTKGEIAKRYEVSATTAEGICRNAQSSLALLDDRETQDAIIKMKVWGNGGRDRNGHQVARDLFLSTYVVWEVLYHLRYEDYVTELRSKYE